MFNFIYCFVQIVMSQSHYNRIIKGGNLNMIYMTFFFVFIRIYICALSKIELQV